MRRPTFQSRARCVVNLVPVGTGHSQASLMIKVPLLEREVEIELTWSARGRRNPARFRDYVPTSKVPSQVGHFLTKKQQMEAAKARAEASRADREHEPLSDGGTGEDSDHPVTRQIVTSPDSFGVFRKYISHSSHNPGDVDPFADIHSVPPSATLTSQPPLMIGSGLSTSSAKDSRPDPLANSKNPSVDLLLSWYSEGSRDGAAGLDRLVHNHLLHPSFEKSELRGFSAVRALRQFEKDHLSPKPGTTLKPGDGWKCGKVTIRVPCTGHKQQEEDAPEFTVDGIYYRDAVEVITTELMDPDSFANIHIRPFEEWWQLAEGGDPIRVYSEVYTSDAMLQLEKELEESLKASRNPQPDVLETFILSASLYLDSTNLAQFGHASLWPVYMFIGNTSKYILSRPNSFSAHHIAYLPTVRAPLFCCICHMSHCSLPAARHDQRVLLRTLQDAPKR